MNSSVNGMLTDKKMCDSANNLFYEKIKNETTLDLIRNGDLNISNINNNNNNNNNIKSERLSPSNGDVHSSASR